MSILRKACCEKLDERAARLNVSRQAVVKTLLSQALNEERASGHGSKKRA